MAKGSRRVLLINRQFQITFLIYMLVMAMITIAIIYASNYYFFWMFGEIGRSMEFAESHAYFKFIDEQRRVMNLIFGVTSAVVFFGICLGGLVISHRVAGPIYRLRKHMDDLLKGSTKGKVNFREKDFFPELADSYNQLLEKYQK